MTQPAPTFGQIRAKVQAVRRKIPDASAVGIHAPGRYAGDRVRREGADTYRIEQCDSPLAARIALLGDEPAATVTVLVTGLADQDLGDDVLVRLAGRRLYPLDPWQIVKELFQAHAVDPRLRGQGWIADRLLELATAAGVPAAAGGYLDAEIVWPMLLQRLLGLEGDRPDLPLLLRWSAVPENVGRFRRLPDEPRRAIEGWLSASLGPTAAAVLRCAGATDQPDALPVGLALGVVHHPAAAGQLDRAAGRLERFLGGPTPEPAVTDRWHAAATEAVRLLDADTRARNGLLHRAEEVLREVQADEFAHLTDVLPRGFEQRLARLGGLLAVTADEPPAVAELTAARDAVRRHDQARREPRRVERVDMALRLARWLAAAGPEVAPRSLGAAAAEYVAQGSFVDWARSALRAGDPVRELSEGYARLLARVAARREAQNRRFAELLRDQTAAAARPADVTPVEAVLDQLVAPLAALAPVLVVLLDGMSPAVSRELTADLTRLDWASLGPGGRALPPGLAAIPCVTEASRTSLFCGRLATGSVADEAAGFAAHAALKLHCRAGQPPVLFHKIALTGPGDAALAANVREAVASAQKRVVGVVVNAVDDHLLKGEQLDLRWTRDEIKVLLPLLYEARSARRVVVLLSDHGHLLDDQTRAADGDGGERWRSDDGRPGEGELALRGPRVLLGDGHRLIAPWTERLRYVGRKNGYHGGLTPQEMLIPITVLAAGDLRPDGWVDAPDPAPDWWEPAPPLAALPAVVLPPKPSAPKVPTSLFDDEEETPAVPPVAPAVASSPIWVAALLASPVFTEQKKLGGRAVPDDATFAGLLAALDEAGGKLTSAALARRMSLPPFRLRGLLAVCQRVLNVDGFAVLGRDDPSDTVELNRSLLLRQFDLIAEDRP
ncbi:PglZ domain protein [Gemmata obscuriglobus]|uniref:BREX-2 system phosphatase PglZ n=1 Tax=Gemmata obscuriglobus TaxID=114 RepID=UPI00016C4654|nr:BREX-2 system phosphatase PglZ [Gemmata obscuriglobus]QEG30343.1 PglZ domain protein [Gemmata obscuriglobus]VTS09667.1 Bacteriophage (PhiC31) resistance gene PglZ OS=Planctomyces maris DSM 8797 GN=PM8797T_23469 PE=4 SV=1: PglZ [Gemmata obscuriglobus UQM 2246]